MKAKKSFRWTNLERWNALKEYFGLDIYLQVNFDKQKNLFIINKIKIERWLNSFIWMWKVKTFKVFRCQLFKIFLYNCKSLSSIHFNILKLLHFQSHTYIWKSWDQIFEFFRLKYCFKYISIFSRVLFYHALYSYSLTIRVLSFMKMKIKEDNIVNFTTIKKNIQVLFKKKKNGIATENKILFFSSFFFLEIVEVKKFWI